MNPAPFMPDKEQVAALDPFERLPLTAIELVATGAQAERAIAALAGAAVLGFDTESKPTFAKGEVSDGPHIVQLATLDRAWIFQLHDPACRAALSALLESHRAQKVGFGLGDDIRRIRGKLGVEAFGVVDLNHLFRARGYRKDIGVKTAVAILFERRFMKSGKASTSNWAARQLSESQLLYAANDAWAAARVFDAIGRLGAPRAPVRSPA
jgi:ribonuclease D